jgi:hypothetical protein
MKKIDSKKKLTLKREAVRTLTADELNHVDGGTITTGVPPLPTRPVGFCVRGPVQQ